MTILESPILPPECKGHILSFLCLDDVLQFACTCSTALSDTLSDLHRRRENMKKPLAYSSASKGCGFGLWETMTVNHPTIDWIYIPSLQNRVGEVCKNIPAGHPMANTIHDLYKDLAQNTAFGKSVANAYGFTAIFEYYKRFTRVLKMHSAILNYLLHSDQMRKDFSVNLDQYIGDVLCIAYLIHQNQEPLATKCPFDCDWDQWTAQKRCYLSWVVLHSNILRVKSFASSERERLGNPKFYGLSEVVPLNSYMNDLFLSSKMTLVYREFGPLGPAFRGRDTVGLRELSAGALANFMFNSHDRGVMEERAMNAFEWLCLVHEQSRKARPMTVRPPQMRLVLGRH